MHPLGDTQSRGQVKMFHAFCKHCETPTGCNRIRPLRACATSLLHIATCNNLHCVGEEDGLRDLTHGFAIVHAGALNLAECIRLRQALLLHE